MSDANEQEQNTTEQERKRPLTLGRSGGRLELRKPVETAQVRQSFSHGRSKTVTVEVRKKRVISPGLPEAGRTEASPASARVTVIFPVRRRASSRRTGATGFLTSGRAPRRGAVPGSSSSSTGTATLPAAASAATFAAAALPARSATSRRESSSLRRCASSSDRLRASSSVRRRFSSSSTFLRASSSAR